MKFYIGTTNPHKVREMAGILGPLQIPMDVTPPLDPDETGETFSDNAVLKAQVYGRHIGESLAARLADERGVAPGEALNHLKLARVYTIGEDSGLVVPKLEGLPGPLSARFDDCLLEGLRVMGIRESHRSRTEIDAANIQRVLELLKDVEDPYRVASFVVNLAVADVHGEIVFQTERRTDGWIVKEPRGTKGFGYDPIFASGNSYGHTWAEIDAMRKNLISHRRQALMDFTTWLARQLKMTDVGY